ncbi:hypothetical protein IKF04_01380 [Candidatus Saccharibacteria bacterium]|nr:hypothetical protein [Candidatus Saccharibacteria bacterium]
MTKLVGADALTIVKVSSTEEELSDTKAAKKIYHFMRGNDVVLKLITKTPILEPVKKSRFWRIFTADASKLEDYICLGDIDSCFDLKVKIESVPHRNAFEAVLPSLRLKSYADGGPYDELSLEQQVDNEMIPLKFTAIEKGSYAFYSIL